MIARCGALFVGNSAAMMTIAAVGAFTALFAACIALRQFDLKKVFAYSTVSQLGFMFVGVGVLAPVAGVFHLITHAFFKALLFLSSGVVMHAMMGELDLRKMSGLKTVLPKTRWLMLIGCIALAGLPPLAGFWSKDEIVGAAYEKSALLSGILLLTAFMTAYYTFRLYFRVFEGPTVVPPPPAGGHGHGADSHDSHGHGEHEHHNHEPALMIFPLVLLAIGAIFAGAINLPFGGETMAHRLGHFLGASPSFQTTLKVADNAYGKEHVNPIPLGAPERRDAEEVEHEHHTHLMFAIISAIVAAAGVGLAYQLHLKNRESAEGYANRFRGIVRVLDGKFWVDEVYQAGIVEPMRSFGRTLFTLDRWVVDGIVNVIGIVPQASGFVLKIFTQRGYLQGYATFMLLGIVVILVLIFWQS
jgi:NADH-quinone oxidoreductase subunit L